MAKYSLGIFDKETDYAERLGAYIMMKEGASFNPHVFTDESMLLRALDKLDFALVPESFEEAYGNGKLVRLVDQRDKNPGKQIEKYKKASELVAGIRDLFEISREESPNSRGKIICVVSPGRHELQMLFTLCLCKERAIDSRVLYVNLLEASGFENIFGCESDRTLEDLLAVIPNGTASLEAYVHDVEGVSAILPCSRPEALWEIDSDTVNALIGFFEDSGYDTVVMDMGSAFPGSYEIYGAAKEIIVLGRDGFLSEEAHRQWSDNLSRHLGNEILEKQERVALHLTSAGIRASEFLLGELYRGNLGDFIRENVSAGK